MELTAQKRRRLSQREGRASVFKAALEVGGPGGLGGQVGQAGWVQEAPRLVSPLCAGHGIERTAGCAALGGSCSARPAGEQALGESASICWAV